MSLTRSSWVARVPPQHPAIHLPPAQGRAASSRGLPPGLASKSPGFPVRDPGQGKMGAAVPSVAEPGASHCHPGPGHHTVTLAQGITLSPRPCPPGHAGRPYPLPAGGRPPWRLTQPELAAATGFTPGQGEGHVPPPPLCTRDCGGERPTPCPRLGGGGAGAALGSLALGHAVPLPP